MSSQPVAMAPPPTPMASPRRCRAHSSQSGEPCQAYAIRGGLTCVAHGGAAGHVKAKAQERLTQHKIGAFLAAQGIDEAEGDPLEILLRQLSVSDAVSERARDLVSELDEIVTANHNGDAKPHVLLKIWNEERDRVAKLAKIGLDNGLAEAALERMAQLSEEQGRLVADSFTAAMNDPALNLTPEQKAAAKRAGARHHRAQAPTE